MKDGRFLLLLATEGKIENENRVDAVAALWLFYVLALRFLLFF